MGTVQHLTWHEGLEDEAFLALLRAKDPDAVATFFDRYEREVNSLVWSLLGADLEHDDLVHDAFESMLRGIRGVRTLDALPGWVRMVTVNTVRQSLRKRRWKRLFSPLDDVPEPAAHQVLDEGRRETVRQVYRALDGLDTGARAALVLRHLEGYELTEVAEALGISLATAKRWLVKAEARFTAKYEGRGEEGRSDG